MAVFIKNISDPGVVVSGQHKQVVTAVFNPEADILAGHGTVEDDISACFGCFTGAHMSQRAVFRGDAFDQYFNFSAGRFVAKQPGRNDPGIVEHEDVIGLEQIGEIRKLPVF